jgi:hypothetical protein
MAWSDVLKAVIPIVVAALAWLLGQVASFSERLTKIEGQMPALKEQLMTHINDLQVKVRLLEERERIAKGNK